MAKRILGTIALAATALAGPITFNQAGVSGAISLVQNGSATDVHMQAWAPTSAGWGAIGMGSQMENSLMFVMYPSANGRSVTVSARTASGHVMPKLDPTISTKVTNSSVNPSGLMMAEFICYGCTHWSNGMLSTSSSSQPFVYAVGPGPSMNSDDPNAPIHKHTNNGMFTGNTISAYTSPSTSTTSEPASKPPAAGNATKPKMYIPRKQIYAHAILLCLVFFLLMPTAVVLLRLPFIGKAAFKVHWMIHVLAFFASVAALGVAVKFSHDMTHWHSMTNFHQIIGIILTCVIILQAAAGTVHHVMFKRKPRRTAVSYSHIVLGWSIIFLGMLNGCFGLWLRENKKGAGILGAAGIVILLGQLGVSLWAGARRRKMNAQRAQTGNVRMPGSPSDTDSREEVHIEVKQSPA